MWAFGIEQVWWCVCACRQQQKGPGLESLNALQHLGRSCERNGDTPQAQSGTTRDGTRTHNLILRGEAPYPLGHTSNSHSCEQQVCLFVRELS